MGTYQHIPNPKDDQYLYNIDVFSQDGLNNTEHTLVINVESGSMVSLLLFDWAIYTYVLAFVSESIVMMMRIHHTQF